MNIIFNNIIVEKNYDLFIDDRIIKTLYILSVLIL